VAEAHRLKLKNASAVRRRLLVLRAWASRSGTNKSAFLAH
jgi:hypothetical protein